MDYHDFISKDFSYALIGATTNREKYGYVVLKDLVGAGHRIVGVNPHYQEIDGVKIYKFLKDVPTKLDVVIFVTPPEVGVKVLDEVAALGIRKAWFQPGAESEEIRVRAAELGVKAVADGSCIMVVRRGLS